MKRQVRTWVVVVCRGLAEKGGMGKVTESKQAKKISRSNRFDPKQP
jgi:hypothetical protein